ncbi:hypothetical protein [Actinoplanes awajinensis]|uniref:ADP ribosyltransferase domain-containing protein n=1 Tax=Actinoplanes awajinensis subsp. mycoplanecinus TaxID=135947 RepID=A0A124G7F9_9ACTN|nr:hypothetical protein [Actinoplanes awajinensis]KUL22660.1 hypothetical protein ADL15_47755 [Actinoplanes awajinensis subsp. mycoplanecinus]
MANGIRGLLRGKGDEPGRVEQHIVGNATVLHGSDRISAEAQTLAMAVVADADNDIVVLDLGAGMPINSWEAMARVLPRRRRGIRLVACGRSTTAAAMAGQWLSERLNRTVIAPDGELIRGSAGTLFVHSQPGSGWVRFRPGKTPTWESKRYPAPLWDLAAVDSRASSAIGEIEPLPGGVWIHDTRDTATVATHRQHLITGVPCQPDVMTVLLGCPGTPPLSLDDVVRFWRGLDEDARARTRFVQYGDVRLPEGEALGQALADLLAANVICYTGVPVGTPDKYDLRTVLPDGTLGWPPFARELGYVPRVHKNSRPRRPVVLSHRAPLRWTDEIAPRVFWYAPDAVVEVVEAGLWIRGVEEPGNAERVRATALDPQQSTLIFDDSVPAQTGRMRELAADLAARLDDMTAPGALVPASVLVPEMTRGGRATAAADVDAITSRAPVDVTVPTVVELPVPAAEPQSYRAPMPAFDESQAFSVSVPLPAPSPVFDESQAFSGPLPVFDDSQAFSMPLPLPVVEEPSVLAVAEQSSALLRPPVAYEPPPVVEEPAAVEQPPVVEEPAPVVEEPAAFEPAPVVEEPPAPVALVAPDEPVELPAAPVDFPAAPVAPAPPTTVDIAPPPPPVEPPPAVEPPPPFDPGMVAPPIEVPLSAVVEVGVPAVQPTPAASAPAPVDLPGPVEIEAPPVVAAPVAPAAPAGPRVRQQPVPDPATSALLPNRPLDEERVWVRRTLSRDFDTMASSVARIMSEHPGLQSAGHGTDDVLVDSVAVRLFLSARGPGVDAGLRAGRNGPHVPLARCAVSGLSRLPSFRGTTIFRMSPLAEEWELYRQRRLFSDWGFVTAMTQPDEVQDGDTDVLLWSMTGRRTALLEPQDDERIDDRVVFLPGTSFKVLELREPSDDGRGSILMREIGSNEIDDEGRVDPDRVSLDELAVTSLHRSLERWAGAPAKRRIGSAARARFDVLPGLERQEVTR